MASQTAVDQVSLAASQLIEHAPEQLFKDSWPDLLLSSPTAICNCGHAQRDMAAT